MTKTVTLVLMLVALSTILVFSQNSNSADLQVDWNLAQTDSGRNARNDVNSKGAPNDITKNFQWTLREVDDRTRQIYFDQTVKLPFEKNGDLKSQLPKDFFSRLDPGLHLRVHSSGFYKLFYPPCTALPRRSWPTSTVAQFCHRSETFCRC
jgi:hypothetical protein